MSAAVTRPTADVHFREGRGDNLTALQLGGDTLETVVALEHTTR